MQFCLKPSKEIYGVWMSGCIVACGICREFASLHFAEKSNAEEQLCYKLSIKSKNRIVFVTNNLFYAQIVLKKLTKSNRSRYNGIYVVS